MHLPLFCLSASCSLNGRGNYICRMFKSLLPGNPEFYLRCLTNRSLSLSCSLFLHLLLLLLVLLLPCSVAINIHSTPFSTSCYSCSFCSYSIRLLLLFNILSSPLAATPARFTPLCYCSTAQSAPSPPALTPRYTPTLFYCYYFYSLTPALPAFTYLASTYTSLLLLLQLLLCPIILSLTPALPTRTYLASTYDSASTIPATSVSYYSFSYSCC